MAEFEEELTLEVPCEKLKLRTNAHNDRLTIDKISLTSEQAATIAWLVNQTEGTALKVEIKIA